MVKMYKKTDKTFIVLLVVCGLLLLGFASYIINDLDKKAKIQSKEIERQQLVITLQQVKIDSYKVKNQLTKEDEDVKRLIEEAKK